MLCLGFLCKVFATNFNKKPYESFDANLFENARHKFLNGILWPRAYLVNKFYANSILIAAVTQFYQNRNLANDFCATASVFAEMKFQNKIPSPRKQCRYWGKIYRQNF